MYTGQYDRPSQALTDCQAVTARKAGNSTTRVLIVDENPVFRRGLVSVLREQADFDVLGDVSCLGEAESAIIGPHPDVVIVDSQTPESDGSQTIEEVRRTFPGSKVFVLTASADQSCILKAMRTGAKGYALKSASVSELMESLRLIAHGEAVVYPSRIATPAGNLGLANESSSSMTTLSPREQEVLALVAQGASNKEIAAACFVSESTVKAHVRRILDKLSVKNRAQAVGIALTRGLLAARG